MNIKWTNIEDGLPPCNKIILAKGNRNWPFKKMPGQEKSCFFDVHYIGVASFDYFSTPHIVEMDKFIITKMKAWCNLQKPCGYHHIHTSMKRENWDEYTDISQVLLVHDLNYWSVID